MNLSRIKGLETELHIGGFIFTGKVIERQYRIKQNNVEISTRFLFEAYHDNFESYSKPLYIRITEGGANDAVELLTDEKNRPIGLLMDEALCSRGTFLPARCHSPLALTMH